MISATAIAKVRLAIDLSSFSILISTVFQLMTQTLLTQATSHASSSLSTQTEILNFLLITHFKYHVTEYCAVIGVHSTVRGDKLLYGHVPDPFPQCGIGSGHMRLVLGVVGYT